MEYEFALSEDQLIPDGQLVEICKYRQGSSCCRYVVFFEKPGRFYCVKRVPKLKEKVDSQVHEMNAKSDNCEGLLYETRTDDERVQE